MRINFVGELGWELHHPIAYQNQIFDSLVEAGKPFGLTMCGMRAMDSLRIEKSYRMWGQDLTTDYTALESGLDRFVKLDKEHFVGREALMEKQPQATTPCFVTMSVEAHDADAWGNEPLYNNDRKIGRAAAGAFGHAIGQSLALGYVENSFASPGTKLQIEILGKRCDAAVISESPLDPTNERPRS